MVQIRRAGEQKWHWDKTNKEPISDYVCLLFALSQTSATLALQRGGFVPREWLAAKGLFAKRNARINQWV